MTGKERIQAAFQRQKVDKTPWVPFVGCHGGKLMNMNAEKYLQSAESMVNGASKAVELYKPDGIPVGFDLQIEAEILGCNLIWADENPPAVTSHPLSEGVRLSDLKPPEASEGRLPLFLETAAILRKKFPDLALYGLVTGPFTLAMHLQGTDLFMKMFEDEEAVHDLIEFCKQVTTQVSRYYLDAGCDVIAVVDPMTSQISPDQFRQFVTPAATEIFTNIRQLNRLGSFFVCGQAQQNIEAMCECGPDNISVDENIPLDYVRDICLPRGVSFGGNLQLTVVLLMGTPEDSQRNAVECMDIGGQKGFILAPGCDLPYATPVENLQAIAELVNDSYQQEIIRTLDKKQTDDDVLDMHDYGKIDKVVVDIITLDSEACAPCQYMVEAVKNIAPQFNNIVEWREHKIKHHASVRFMTSLMVKNIPTICIDGKITFVSRIPPKEELIAAIQKRIIAKLEYKIRTRKGEIIILGHTQEECDSVKPLVQQAIHELGATVPVSCLMDEKEIVAYGVVRTPAVVVAQYKIKAEESIPPVPAIKEWIKEIQ